MPAVVGSLFDILSETLICFVFSPQMQKDVYIIQQNSSCCDFYAKF